ncbi:MAG: nuclear transport factor 2 family protein [Pseudoxanthomonas sp.]
MLKQFAVFALAMACLFGAHAQDLDVEAKKKLAAAGAAVGKAIAEHDIPALEKLWSPKLLVNGPNNHVLTRTEIFDAMKRGQLDYEDGYKSTPERIEFYGNVAVSMGEDTYVPDFGPEKGKTIHRRSTNVWQYADGAWTMIARQATIYDPDAKHY